VGVHLARLELKVILVERLRLIPEFELGQGFSPNVVHSEGVDRLATLPLRWGSMPAYTGGGGG
jgi:hypothetical protein